MRFNLPSNSNADGQSPSFQHIQRSFGAYVRTGDDAQRPEGVSRERGEIYRELTFNNIKGFLDNNFPVLSKIFGEQAWQDLARQFVAEHACSTPYFLEIGREFLSWFRGVAATQCGEWPFAVELAHYEWAELAIAVAEDEAEQGFAEVGLLDTRPLISRNAWSLRYDYPVHQIGPDFLPTEPPEQQTFLLVYRDPQDDVQFMQINALTWLLVENLRQTDTKTADQILTSIAAEFPQLSVESVLAGGEQTLAELQQRGVVIGSQLVAESS